jgi:hypothetical protein
MPSYPEDIKKVSGVLNFGHSCAFLRAFNPCPQCKRTACKREARVGIEPHARAILTESENHLNKHKKLSDSSDF